MKKRGDYSSDQHSPTSDLWLEKIIEVTVNSYLIKDLKMGTIFVLFFFLSSAKYLDCYQEKYVVKTNL